MPFDSSYQARGSKHISGVQAEQEVAGRGLWSATGEKDGHGAAKISHYLADGAAGSDRQLGSAVGLWYGTREPPTADSVPCDRYRSHRRMGYEASQGKVLSDELATEVACATREENTPKVRPVLGPRRSNTAGAENACRPLERSAGL